MRERERKIEGEGRERGKRRDEVGWRRREREARQHVYFSLSVSGWLSVCAPSPLSHSTLTTPSPSLLLRSLWDMTYTKLLDSSKDGFKRWDGKPVKKTPKISELDPDLVQKIKDLTEVCWP